MIADCKCNVCGREWTQKFEGKIQCPNCKDKGNINLRAYDDDKSNKSISFFERFFKFKK